MSEVQNRLDEFVRGWRDGAHMGAIPDAVDGDYAVGFKIGSDKAAEAIMEWAKLNNLEVRCEWWNGPTSWLMTADGEIRITPNGSDR